MKAFVGLIIVSLTLVLAGDIWRFAGSDRMDPELAGTFKLIAFVIAGCVLLVYGWRVSRSSRPIVECMLWAIGAAAFGGFLEAYFIAERTQWGRACNQCNPILLLLVIPAVYGLLGLLAVSPFLWFRTRRRPETHSTG